MTSLRVTTVLACTRRIAEAVATVPWRIFQVGPNGQREPATGHPLYDLLDSGPNEWQDSLQFRETLSVHAVLAGAGAAFVNRVGGKIAEMIPLLPDRCRPVMGADFSLMYRITAPDGTTEMVSPGDVYYVRGISWDGYSGLDIVRLAREAIGLSLATEQTHAMLHANGARLSGIVSVKGQADEARLIRLAAWVRRHVSGLDNTSNVLVIDDEAKFTPLTMTGVDAQHIALRQHQVEEDCRALGVLPMVIGHPADMAARAAVDTIANMHLMNTVRPWHRRFDKAADKQLLTADERRQGYYTKLLDGEFLRATAKDRAQYNQLALGGGASPGWASVNDVRGWDEMDAVPGGDHIYAPLNAGPIGPDGIPQTARVPSQTQSG
jgi:HK97 family phage portal protein